MKDCSVCEMPFDSNYCPNCGQKKFNGKVTFKSVLADFTNALFQLDRSVTANLFLAFKDPARIIDNYLGGYRNYYFSPAKFFILASLVLALNFLITESSFFNLSVKSTGGLSVQFAFLLFMLIFYSFTSFIAFYKWKKTFLEHVIINLYTISFWTILFTPISILSSYLGNPWISQGASFLYLLMIFIWNARVFKMSNWKRLFHVLLNILLWVSFLAVIIVLTNEAE